MLTRRGLLCAMPALICAPAIVRASSLMPVKAWGGDDWQGAFNEAWRFNQFNPDRYAALAKSVWQNNALLERLRQRHVVMTDAQWSGRVVLTEYKFR